MIDPDLRATLVTALKKRVAAELAGTHAKKGRRLPHRIVGGTVLVWKREGMAVRVEMSTGRRFKLSCSSAAFARSLVVALGAYDAEPDEDAVDFMRRCVATMSQGRDDLQTVPE